MREQSVIDPGRQPQAALQAEGPAKLFVEVTTRCNLRCAHCVKQAPGSCIGDEDMAPEVFEALLPSLAGASMLVLNGIGEPLLHPLLADFVRRARAAMPAGAAIGFQTNGVLLTAARAAELLGAGASTICLSVDSCDPGLFGRARGGAQLSAMERALAAVDTARAGHAGFRLGLEAVVGRDNLGRLADTVRWAAAQGADYLLVSHLLPYDAAGREQGLFSGSPRESREFFARWRSLAEGQGLDLERYFATLGRFLRTAEDQRVLDFVAGMMAEARALGLPVHLRELLDHDPAQDQAVAQAFDAARAAAEQCGLELRLPALAPELARRCAFVEEGGAFVDVHGRVAPCYFLWHDYACRATGQGPAGHVRALTFGSVADAPLADIWSGPEYDAFRRGVLAYDYPHCAACPAGPCSDARSLGRDFERDCHGVEVPCGACPWCLGGFQCLR